MKNIVYTVYCDQQGYPVRYLDWQTCHTGWFTGPFDDPGEASQEFQASLGNTASCSYLDEPQFQATAGALMCQHRQALHRWRTWNALAHENQTPQQRKES